MKKRLESLHNVAHCLLGLPPLCFLLACGKIEDEPERQLPACVETLSDEGVTTFAPSEESASTRLAQSPLPNSIEWTLAPDSAPGIEALSLAITPSGGAPALATREGSGPTCRLGPELALPVDFELAVGDDDLLAGWAGYVYVPELPAPDLYVQSVIDVGNVTLSDEWEALIQDAFDLSPDAENRATLFEPALEGEVHAFTFSVAAGFFNKGSVIWRGEARSERPIDN